MVHKIRFARTLYVILAKIISVAINYVEVKLFEHISLYIKKKNIFFKGVHFINKMLNSLFQRLITNMNSEKLIQAMRKIIVLKVLKSLFIGTP